MKKKLISLLAEPPKSSASLGANPARTRDARHPRSAKRVVRRANPITPEEIGEQVAGRAERVSFLVLLDAIAWASERLFDTYPDLQWADVLSSVATARQYLAGANRLPPLG